MWIPCLQRELREGMRLRCSRGLFEGRVGTVSCKTTVNCNGTFHTYRFVGDDGGDWEVHMEAPDNGSAINVSLREYRKTLKLDGYERLAT